MSKPTLCGHPDLVTYFTLRCRELLQERNNLSREDLEYLVSHTQKLRDDRLQACVATLVGWGDDERAELETFCAIALEAIKMLPTKKFQQAVKIVQTRAIKELMYKKT